MLMDCDTDTGALSQICAAVNAGAASANDFICPAFFGSWQLYYHQSSSNSNTNTNSIEASADVRRRNPGRTLLGIPTGSGRGQLTFSNFKKGIRGVHHDRESE